MTDDPRHVTILLGTFNGARFLPAQLASYLRQTHRNWSLRVSDDGSTDATMEVLEAFRQAQVGLHEVRLLRGPMLGRAGPNYLSLLTGPDLPEGVVALSDQDDIWLPGKLARAMRQVPEAAGPCIYSAQSLYLDAQGRRAGRSVPPPNAPVFATAMLQNVMAGHSMVLNAAALRIVQAAGLPAHVTYHDWWLTLLILGCGGQAVLDRRAVTLYRQHGANALGAPGGARAARVRVARILGGDYGAWVRGNAHDLADISPLLTTEARETVEAFLAARVRAGPGRIAMLHRLGLRRQTLSGTMQAYVAAFLGRL